jgi:hypothetical protein
MQPKVGHVPRRWKVCAETTAKRLTTAEETLKDTMIGYLVKKQRVYRVEHLDEETGIPTALELFINTELTCADNFPGCAARYHASEPSSSTTLATIATSNACSLEIPRRATGQPHRQSHGTSFRQSNTALGMQQRVQVCGHRVDCEVGDLPDQDDHLSSKDGQSLGR